MSLISFSRRAAARALLAQLGLLSAPQAGVQAWSSTLSGQAGAASVLERLRAVQVDPVAAVERNHHLVLMNRVADYRPEHLDNLFASGHVFEYLANARCILPVVEFPRFWPVMRQLARNNPAERERIKASMLEVLQQIQANGKVQARQVGNDGPRLLGLGYNAANQASKASGHALDLLWLSGDLVVGRNGGTKYYDLPERMLPAEIVAMLDPPLRRNSDGILADPDTARAADGPVRPWSTPQATTSGAVSPWSHWLLDMYADAYHVFEAGDARLGWQRHPAAERRALLADRVEQGSLVPVQIDGVRRQYWATPATVDLIASADAWDVEPIVRFIPPLDNLLWRRERLTDLFEFDYTWEIYHPRSKRRYGYYAMPILYGDRLIGRIDPRLDRQRNHLSLTLLQIEPGVKLGKRDCRRLTQAIEAFAQFHGATGWSIEQMEPTDLLLPD